MIIMEGPSFETPKQKDNINSLLNDVDDKNYTEKFNKLEKVLQTKNVPTEDVVDAFNDHGDELLEGIRDDMLRNFNKIDGKKEWDPQLKIYEAAYNAFETDIKTLIKQSQVTEKVEEKEKEAGEKVFDDVYATSTSKEKKETGETSKYIEKLDKLIAIIQEIKYIIQLKKLEKGEDPGKDFDAGKLQVFVKKTKYFKENLPNTTESWTTRESLIIAKNEEIIKKNNEEKKDEKDKRLAKDVLNINRTEGNVVDFFEGNKERYEATFNYIQNKNKGSDDITKTKDITTTEDLDTKNFIKLIELYTKSTITPPINGSWSDKEQRNVISNIKLTNYQDTNHSPKIEYEETTYTCKVTKGNDNTDIISRTPWNLIKKEISFGTQDNLQQIRANIFNVNNSDPDLANDNPLTQFDGGGNYRAFEKYINTETWGKEFADNFKHVVDAILTYKKPTNQDNADYLENENDLKNGYANVLTNYVLSVHPRLSKIYISYLTPGNLNILGTDKKTRLANLAKLGKSTAFINSLTEDEKKTISDIRVSASEAKKTTLQDAINNMSNLIVGLMSMLGFGKWTLKKRFPNMKEKIDGIYQKEFKLDPKEIECIQKMKWDGSFKIWDEKRKKVVTKEDGTKEYRYIVPKADEIKESMSEWEISSELATKYKDYLSFIDPKILEKGIILYNEKAGKDGKDKITQSNFVMTKNGKLEINVKGIQNNPDDFKNIIKALLDSDETWKTIATANANIRETTTVKGKDNAVQMSEYFEDISDRNLSIIKSEQDIAAYFGAYLFAGSKSLAYTVTENKLVQIEWISEDTDTQEKLTTYTVKEQTKLYQESDIKKPIDVYSGMTVTATKSEKKTGEALWLTGEDKTEFTQVMLADGKTIGWIKTAAMKETVVVTDKSKELNINTKYATVSADGVYTLTAAVEPVKIHNIFTGQLPEKLRFTSKKLWTKTEIIKGINPEDSNTYTYLDAKSKNRVVIHEWDQIEAATEEKTVVEIMDEKRTSIETEINKVQDSKYEEYDITKYQYEVTPSDTQKVYETKILNPMMNLLKILCDVDKINDKYYSEYKESFKWKEGSTTFTFENYIPHIKNILVMMWWADKTYQTIIDKFQYGNTYEVNWINEITIRNSKKKEIGKLTFSYEEKNGTRVLNPKRTELQET